MSEHAKPVKTTALLFAGVLAALCWTVGDMLLVGFVPQPERHPQLAVLAGRMEGDVQMAALMLDAAPARLLWGVLPATFSAPFYLAAAFGVYRLLRPGRAAVLCFALLFFSYALAPLAHAGFYYLGSAAQTLLAARTEDLTLALAQYNGHYRLLALHSETAALVGGATFNLAQLVFYTAALLWLRRHKAA